MIYVYSWKQIPNINHTEPIGTLSKEDAEVAVHYGFAEWRHNRKAIALRPGLFDRSGQSCKVDQRALDAFVEGKPWAIALIEGLGNYEWKSDRAIVKLCTREELAAMHG